MAVNRLYYGDNLDVLRQHVADESVDLIYLDPPFNSNRNYNVIFARNGTVGDPDSAQIRAFTDTWRWTPVTEQQYQEAISGRLPNEAADALTAMRTLLGENDAMAYLVNMAPRLVELRRVLKPTGSIYLHCDPTMSHYLKILMDSVFGPKNFRNEVIWWYRKWSKSTTHFLRNHDVLLFYGKAANQQFNILRVPLSPSTLKRFGGRVQDFADEARTRKITLDQASEGGFRPDVWDINLLPAAAAERLGYPTQKPLALLEVVLAASSNPGDVVLDPFCGCGTTLAAAQSMGRRWIGIDITYIAVDLIEKRLRHTFGESIVGTYDTFGIPRDLAGAQALFDRSPFDFERWAVSLVNGTPNQKQVGDKGIDGVIRFLTDGKGGTGRGLVSVKGGRNVGPTAARDLGGTLQTQKAEMGILVTMAPPTRGVVDEANHAGTYTWPINGQTFPRIQIATVPDLLAGRRPSMPAALMPYIAAARRTAPVDQLTLDDSN